MIDQSGGHQRRVLRCKKLGLLFTLTTLTFTASGQERNFAAFEPVAQQAPTQTNIFDSLGNALYSTLTNAISSATTSGFNEFNPLRGENLSSQLGTSCMGNAVNVCPYTDPDARRNVSEIIISRGFQVEEHDVVTRDGYILSIQRIINPLVDVSQRAQMKPIILQHGLLASSVDWVINSQDIRPRKPRVHSLRRTSAGRQTSASNLTANYSKRSFNQPATTTTTTTTGNQIRRNMRQAKLEASSALFRAKAFAADLKRAEQESPNSLAFYLANEGYDVFLANSRGNLYAQRHVNMTMWNSQFWAFSFDEQIKFDLPATLEHVQRLTQHKKVGYVGHSQGTAMMFGLLADMPHYADTFEPIVLLAPVAFVGNCVSPARLFAIYTPIFQHLDMWFGSSQRAVKYLAPLVCGPEVIRKDLCTSLIFLSAGFNEGQLNETRVSAYLAHMPSGTSWKNVAHWGQAVLGGRFAKFDHGPSGNRQRYGLSYAPDYDLGKIRSKSLVMFTGDNDWLASPRDVARLKSSLRVPLYKSVNVSEILPQWNHIDFLYGKDSGRYVNDPIVDIFKDFD